jgi:D-arabinose 1-dehydrogenase-like Zn-dependent alcohol dehydrogenase
VSPANTIRVATFAGPGAAPAMRRVPWPDVGKKAALIKVGACGVCGTDLHILKGHWPKPLPWPFTLGHELGGVIVERGAEFTEDFMGKPLAVGSKVMIPPLMPCGRCYYCIHYPQQANKCLTPVYYGRYLGFDKPPHLWGGWAEYVYVDLDMLPGTKVYRLPDDMSLRRSAPAASPGATPSSSRARDRSEFSQLWLRRRWVPAASSASARRSGPASRWRASSAPTRR